MFIIDARTGAIGVEQLSWVVEAVTESHRTWKVGGGDIGKRSPTAVWARGDEFCSTYEPPVWSFLLPKNVARKVLITYPEKPL